MGYQEYRKTMILELFFILAIYIVGWIKYPYKEGGYMQASQDDGQNQGNQQENQAEAEKKDAKKKVDPEENEQKQKAFHEVFQIFGIHGIAIGFGMLAPFAATTVFTWLHFGLFGFFMFVILKKPEKENLKFIAKMGMYLMDLCLIGSGANEV